MKLCVLGHGIGYTLSPKLHASFAQTLGENFSYDVADVPPEELESAVKRLFNAYDGFNVTKPYKERVAAIMGVSCPVNTVRCCDGASISTDGEGFLCDYTRAFGVPQGRLLVLGAGGAAKAVLSVLGKIPDVSVHVYNRTYEKAAALAGGRIQAVKHLAERYDAVINGTSLGLHGEQSAPDELMWQNVRYAYDLIYAPPVTPFLQRAQEAGAQTQNGLGMLIYQAIAAQEFWRGKPFSKQQKEQLFARAQTAIQNS